MTSDHGKPKHPNCLRLCSLPCVLGLAVFVVLLLFSPPVRGMQPGTPPTATPVVQSDPIVPELQTAPGSLRSMTAVPGLVVSPIPHGPNDLAPDVPPPAVPVPIPEVRNPPKFMSLPFPPHPQMELRQGWYYNWQQIHRGTDYVRYDPERGFLGYPILAVADGYACGQLDGPSFASDPFAVPTPASSPTATFERGNFHTGPLIEDEAYGDTLRNRPVPPVASDATQTPAPARAEVYPSSYCVGGFGHRVLVRHHVEGQTFYTYYGHLETIADAIPLGSRANTIFVKRGQFIGYAGNTGTGGGAIHLHFGLATPSFGWLDSYDLWTTSNKYPDPNGLNGFHSGPNSFWTTNPPSYAVQPIRKPEGYVVAPTHGSVAVGIVTISGWAQVKDHTIDAVEIWIDGVQRGTAEYGLPRDSSNIDDGFRWEWDTTRELNDTYTVEVRAIASNGERALLLSSGQQHASAFPVHVANPWGLIESPARHAIITDTVEIRGTVNVSGSTLSHVEIWVDGELQGNADFGPSTINRSTGTAQVNSYDVRWLWGTRQVPNGKHDLQIRAVAVNGGSTFLRSSDGIDATWITVPVNIRNTTLDTNNAPPAPATWSFTIDKWNIR